MIYKNVEIHNTAEIIPCKDGGVKWLKIPKKVYDNLERGDTGRPVAENSNGVELRFVIESKDAKIIMQSLDGEHSISDFHVFRGGIQGGCFEGGRHVTGDVCEYTIEKSENTEFLKKISEENGIDWDPKVVRVIFNRGNYRLIGVEGDVRPPQKEQTPKKTLIAYGSSITHGFNSLNYSNGWVPMLAHRLNMDCRNLGMAGSCCLEREFADYIASEGEKGNWDLALLEIGINVLDWEDGKITDRTTNLITEVAGRNKDKQVVVISPFYFKEDYNGGTRAPNWRYMTEKIVKELSLPNVTYINGLDILGSMDLISADEVHPSIYGISQIADRLYDRIKYLAL